MNFQCLGTLSKDKNLRTDITTWQLMVKSDLRVKNEAYFVELRVATKRWKRHD